MIMIVSKHLTKGRNGPTKEIAMFEKSSLRDAAFPKAAIFAFALVLVTGPRFVAGQTPGAAQQQPGAAEQQPGAQNDAPKQAAGGEDGFASRSVSLFDGKTLRGWEGNLDWFRIEEKSVVAGTLKKKIPHNEFLCTEKEYGDFDLRLEVKLVGQGQNAGIQFRSKRVPDSTEVSGYQADVGIAWDRPIWGAIYDESRRRKMLVEPDPELAKRVVKKDQWNKIRVLARGAKIRVFVNGEQTVEYVEKDDTIPRTGIIGLQIHSGKPTEAWYRNLRIEEL